MSDEQPTAVPREYTHRRAPKYRSFILTGVVLGAIVCAVVYLRLDEQERRQLHLDGVVGYLGLILAILGALLGAVLALVIERRQTRRAARR
jgi:formate hydrogenlyase subunit 3/multisubunit Na+/H+ antiporter MnhD subunit